MRTLLVVSFGTVVAVVTGVSLLAVVMGAAMGDRESVVAGVTLWSVMALLVVAGWGSLRLLGAGWSWRRRARAAAREAERHTETERRLWEREQRWRRSR